MQFETVSLVYHYRQITSSILSMLSHKNRMNMGKLEMCFKVYCHGKSRVIKAFTETQNITIVPYTNIWIFHIQIVLKTTLHIVLF